MATKKKKSAPAIDTRWGHQMPGELPELAVEDPFLAAVQQYLRVGGGNADVERALADPSPAVIDFLRRYLALPACADVGVAPWNQLTYNALPTAERRAYSKAHRAVEAVANPRSWGLFYAVRAGVRDPGVRALALARFRETNDAGRFHIARALFDAKEHLTPTELEALATLLDGEATPDTLRSLSFGAWAVHLLDPARAFERLAPYVAADALATPAGEQRAIAVLLALRQIERHDLRWGPVLRPLLRHPVLGGYVVWALDHHPLDASWVDDLVAHLHLDPDDINVFDTQALALLTRIADPRAVPVFLAFLAGNSTAIGGVLDAFERLPDPRLREALTAWVETVERGGGAADWQPLTRAKQLLARAV